MLQQFYPQVPHPYRYELNKDMQLAAAHFIPEEAAGKCQRMHGHTYFINLTVAGDQLDPLGFLVDFKRLKDTIHRRYDHTLLNEHREFETLFPTTEQVASHIFSLVQQELSCQPNEPECLQIVVRETPTSYVVYRPKRGDGQ